MEACLNKIFRTGRAASSRIGRDWKPRLLPGRNLPDRPRLPVKPLRAHLRAACLRTQKNPPKRRTADRREPSAPVVFCWDVHGTGRIGRNEPAPALLASSRNDRTNREALEVFAASVGIGRADRPGMTGPLRFSVGITPRRADRSRNASETA